MSERIKELEEGCGKRTISPSGVYICGIDYYCVICEARLDERKKAEQENKNEWIKVPELGIEVERDVHDKGKSWNELNLSERENELLDVNQCVILANNPKYNNILKMDGSSSEDDFFIKQPFELNRKNGRVARFDAVSDRAILICNWGPASSSPALGVRFTRKTKGRK